MVIFLKIIADLVETGLLVYYPINVFIHEPRFRLNIGRSAMELARSMVCLIQIHSFTIGPKTYAWPSMGLHVKCELLPVV